MIETISKPAILVGNGTVDEEILRKVMHTEHVMVAADGGANTLHRMGIAPDFIIGDLDSLSSELEFPEKTLILEIKDQDSTDLEKCLTEVDAPFYLGLGFTGSRFDHSIEILHVLQKFAEWPIVFVTDTDLIFRLPNEFSCSLPVGTRFSLYPVERSEATSQGLLYPLDGIILESGKMIGTSNEISEPQNSPTSEAEVHEPPLRGLGIDFQINVLSGTLIAIAPIEHYNTILPSLHFQTFLPLQ